MLDSVPRPRSRRVPLALGVALLAALGCRKPEAPTQRPAAPSVRLYLLSNVAGALEPCGCRKDMLGGIDHAAALLASRHAEAPERLVLGAGPLLFQDPELDAQRGDQDRWKAEALAESFAEIQLRAWAPGVNDFAAGTAALGRLSERARAQPLAANLGASGLGLASTALFEVGGYRIGVAGIGAAPPALAPPGDAAAALAGAAQKLQAEGAQIRVALIAAGRGDGLRLAEKVPGFTLVLLGKTTEQGEANDAPAPPTLVGDTLVVQPSNHLQTLAYVDLFIHGEDFSFEDGMGLALAERRQSMRGRLAELEARIARWASEQPAQPERLARGQQDAEKLRAQLLELDAQTARRTVTGSSFRYHVAEVREGAGSDPSVVQRATAYYRRVNDHNRQAFRDRFPPPPPPGGARYLGGNVCAGCHAEADAFWRSTPHAGAYESLSSQFKEFNLDCVSCHVTGYDRPGGSTVTHVDSLKNVQCEACHGPGSRHVESGGAAPFIQRKPAPSTCTSCHHTPHVADDWSADAAWPHILGPGHGAP